MLVHGSTKYASTKYMSTKYRVEQYTHTIIHYDMQINYPLYKTPVTSYYYYSLSLSLYNINMMMISSNV